MSKPTCTMHDERYRDAPLVGRGYTRCTPPTQPATPPTCKQEDTMSDDPTYASAARKAKQCLEQAESPNTTVEVSRKLVEVADAWMRLAAVLNPR